jgi:hypothetical protein
LKNWEYIKLKVQEAKQKKHMSRKIMTKGKNNNQKKRKNMCKKRIQILNISQKKQIKLFATLKRDSVKYQPGQRCLLMKQVKICYNYCKETRVWMNQ